MVRNAMNINQELRLMNHGCWITGLWADLRDASDSSGTRYSEIAVGRVKATVLHLTSVLLKLVASPLQEY